MAAAASPLPPGGDVALREPRLFEAETPIIENHWSEREFSLEDRDRWSRETRQLLANGNHGEGILVDSPWRPAGEDKCAELLAGEIRALRLVNTIPHIEYQFPGIDECSNMLSLNETRAAQTALLDGHCVLPSLKHEALQLTKNCRGWVKFYVFSNVSFAEDSKPSPWIEAMLTPAADVQQCTWLGKKLSKGFGRFFRGRRKAGDGPLYDRITANAAFFRTEDGVDGVWQDGRVKVLSAVASAKRPDDGTFIGYKIGMHPYEPDRHVVIALVIPPRTRTTMVPKPGMTKFRTERAIVAAILPLNAQGRLCEPALDRAFAMHNANYQYRQGIEHIVSGAPFDPNPDVHCGPGLHFCLSLEGVSMYAQENAVAKVSRPIMGLRGKVSYVKKIRNPELLESYIDEFFRAQ